MFPWLKDSFDEKAGHMRLPFPFLSGCVCSCVRRVIIVLTWPSEMVRIKKSSGLRNFGSVFVFSEEERSHYYC